jgi:ABC-type glycerol-3-phosphate transport system substrate-binding protein
MACAAAETGPDNEGFYIATGASDIAGWTFAFGGNILSDDGLGYVYNGEATVKAMEFLVGLMDDGCAIISPERYPNPQFAARQALFTMGSSSGIPYYERNVNEAAEAEGREPDEWNAAALPHTTTDPVQNIYGGDVMIPATTPETQLAAWIFIKYYTSPEIQAEWVKASNYFPTRAGTEAFLGDYMSENPVWASAVKLLPNGTYEPQLISYQAVRDEAGQAFNAILQGADIQETLDNLTATANELQAELVE